MSMDQGSGNGAHCLAGSWRQAICRRLPGASRACGAPGCAAAPCGRAGRRRPPAPPSAAPHAAAPAVPADAPGTAAAGLPHMQTPSGHPTSSRPTFTVAENIAFCFGSALAQGIHVEVLRQAKPTHVEMLRQAKPTHPASPPAQGRSACRWPPAPEPCTPPRSCSPARAPSDKVALHFLLSSTALSPMCSA